MSNLTDRNLAILIGATAVNGSLFKVDEAPSLNNDGWDSLTITYYWRVASLTAEQLAAQFPIGARIGSRTWWIVGSSFSEAARGFYKITVEAKGWASTKPAVIKIGSSAAQQSATNVTAPSGVGGGSNLYAKVETHESMPDISVTYLVADISAGGNTASVGQVAAPPVYLPIAPSVWTLLVEYVYHWPNGWVMTGSNQDRLPGTAAALVTDTYKFIRDKTPG